MKKLFLAVLMFICLVGCDQSEETILKGQIWEYRYDSNPYREPQVYLYRVLDVKNGFVQYEKINSKHESIERPSSNSEQGFRVSQRLIKQRDEVNNG